jgi:hypothetical protein
VDSDAAMIDAWLLEQRGDRCTCITCDVIECRRTPVTRGTAHAALVENQCADSVA